MKRASVSELKANLSKYLRFVKRGDEVTVTDRGVPVARLVSLAEARRTPAATDEVRDRLIRLGLLTPGRGGDCSAIFALPPVHAPGADVSGALQEDREDRV